MKHKRIFASCLALLLLLLTGCQLAREDAGENANGDRLIGVFVTTEYLDLFDMEAYLNDNINKMSGGGEITMDGESGKYQGRLYATLATKTLTSEETGKTTDIQEYVFESMDGIAYFAATVPATEHADSFITSGSDAAISDGHMSLHYGDDEDKTALEGTIYLSPGGAGYTQYINPVYQSADGSVYATTGNGFSVDGVQDEGSVYSQTLEETKTITENGSTKSVSISIKISLATMLPPQKIVLLQMDGDSAILTRTEYVPGTLPDTLIVEPDAHYIILETHKQDRQGNAKVSRSLYDKSDESLEGFFCREDGVCVKQWVQLEW